MSLKTKLDSEFSNFNSLLSKTWFVRLPVNYQLNIMTKRHLSIADKVAIYWWIYKKAKQYFKDEDKASDFTKYVYNILMKRGRVVRRDIQLYFKVSHVTARKYFRLIFNDVKLKDRAYKVNRLMLHLHVVYTLSQE